MPLLATTIWLTSLCAVLSQRAVGLPRFCVPVAVAGYQSAPSALLGLCAGFWLFRQPGMLRTHAGIEGSELVGYFISV